MTELVHLHEGRQWRPEVRLSAAVLTTGVWDAASGWEAVGWSR